jgi:hypothetical protein
VAHNRGDSRKRRKSNDVRLFPASSWRWPSDKVFEDWVLPRHINPVPHVRQSWTLKSWVECLREFFEALDEFGEVCNALNRVKDDDAQLERLTEPTNRMLIDLGHCGEMLLFYQHRLAESDAALDFIHAKEFIQHEAHKLGRKSHVLEIENLIGASNAFYMEVLTALSKANDFIVDRVRNLPPVLIGDFYIARDLYSVGFDDTALLALGRGLERVCRRILSERRIGLQTGARLEIAAEATLFDVVETIGALRWKADGDLLIAKSFRRMLQWLREIRNEGAHAQAGGVDPYEMGPTVATAASKIYESHDSSRRRKLESTVIQKKWSH